MVKKFLESFLGLRTPTDVGQTAPGFLLLIKRHANCKISGLDKWFRYGHPGEVPGTSFGFLCEQKNLSRGISQTNNPKKFLWRSMIVFCTVKDTFLQYPTCTLWQRSTW